MPTPYLAPSYYAADYFGAFSASPRVAPPPAKRPFFGGPFFGSPGTPFVPPPPRTFFGGVFGGRFYGGNLWGPGPRGPRYTFKSEGRRLGPDPGWATGRHL